MKIIILIVVFVLNLNVYSLAPTFDISDEMCEKILWDTMYTPAEKDILTKIIVGNDPYKTIDYLKSISDPYLKKNLSLFTHIQDIWEVLPDNEYKGVVYDLMIYLGTCTTINDYTIKNKWDQRIMRTTYRGRLKTHMKIINTILTGDDDVFYDIGSSFGTETFEIYGFMEVTDRLANKEFHAIDINITQYILYDIRNHIKVSINSIDQITSARYVSDYISKPLINEDDLDIIDTELYVKKFNQLKKNKDRFSISKDNQFILEQVDMIDPAFAKNPKLFYHQSDAKQEYPEEWKKAKLVRIYNLLPYFELKDQILFMRNAISKLDTNGYILFNLVNYSEESVFIFLYEHSTKTVFCIHGGERWTVINKELLMLKRVMNKIHGKNWNMKKMNYMERIRLSS